MSNGRGCNCAARSSHECGCDADWTSQETIDLRAKLASAETVLAAARRCERQQVASSEEDVDTTTKEFVATMVEGTDSWNNLIDAIRNHDKGRE